MGERRDERDCHTKRRRKDRGGCCGDHCAVGCGAFAHNPPFDPLGKSHTDPESFSRCRGQSVSSTRSQGRTWCPQSVLLAVSPLSPPQPPLRSLAAQNSLHLMTEDSGVQRASHLTISSCPQRDRGCGSLVKHSSRMVEALGSVSSTQTNKQTKRKELEMNLCVVNKLDANHAVPLWGFTTAREAGPVVPIAHQETAKPPPPALD